MATARTHGTFEMQRALTGWVSCMSFYKTLQNVLKENLANRWFTSIDQPGIYIHLKLENNPDCRGNQWRFIAE